MSPIALVKAPNRFPELESIYKRFTTATNVIIFHKSTYMYMASVTDGEMTKYLYRCEAELHNLLIYLVDDEVYLVEGIYSVEPIKLTAAHQDKKKMNLGEME